MHTCQSDKWYENGVCSCSSKWVCAQMDRERKRERVCFFFFFLNDGVFIWSHCILRNWFYFYFLKCELKWNFKPTFSKIIIMGMKFECIYEYHFILFFTLKMLVWSFISLQTLLLKKTNSSTYIHTKAFV